MLAGKKTGEIDWGSLDNTLDAENEKIVQSPATRPPETTTPGRRRKICFRNARKVEGKLSTDQLFHLPGNPFLTLTVASLGKNFGRGGPISGGGAERNPHNLKFRANRKGPSPL